MDPEQDYPQLENELLIVDRHFTKASPQHDHRRWEYSLALKALKAWTLHHLRIPTVLYDVGGAGSPFRYMTTSIKSAVVDPAEEGGQALADFVQSGVELADAVFCLSVLEHVEDFPQFLYLLSCLVAPGGLLFFTMDCWNKSGPDTAHFHWDRARIFTPASITNSVAFPLLQRDFEYYGARDFDYHGDHLYGSYTFASLSLVKRA